MTRQIVHRVEDFFRIPSSSLVEVLLVVLAFGASCDRQDNRTTGEKAGSRSRQSTGRTGRAERARLRAAPTTRPSARHVSVCAETPRALRRGTRAPGRRRRRRRASLGKHAAHAICHFRVVFATRHCEARADLKLAGVRPGGSAVSLAGSPRHSPPHASSLASRSLPPREQPDRPRPVVQSLVVVAFVSSCRSLRRTLGRTGAG